ncbi:MAG TPA: MBL fold metallo-hydrolase [Candidatus Polarisedimenticolaceae bacterium]|nr:MBL fold metallo-hydrolase [Candidatus Polarisedimenticolaceae bacterium]
MSVLPEGIAPADPPVPRDSALGVVVRRAPHGLEVLLGRRARRARFMPGNLVFPGGVLDPQDGHGEERWRCCASRELAEEAGLVLPPQAWEDLGERITPPLFPVRFRTRFFLAEVSCAIELPAPPSPDEIEALAFHRPAQVLEAWQRGEAQVPPPVLPLLRALRDGHAQGLAARLREVNAGEARTPRIEFVPDVWMLPLRTRTLPPATHTNVWMPGGTRFVVLDPGTADGEELGALARAVERRVGEGATLEAILLTHGHPDHVAGAHLAADLLGVPVRAHALVLDALAAALGPRAGEPLAEGDVLDLGGLRLVTLETPGHAPGHLAFHLPERRAAIVGDLLSSLSTILVDPEEGDMDAFLASLARVGDLQCRTLLPAHGGPLPGRALEDARAHRRARTQRIVEALHGGATSLRAIAEAAYADTPGAPAPLRERQTLAHLLALERAGRAFRRGDLWRA